MTDWHDRLLDEGLKEVLGNRKAPDFSGRIRAAAGRRPGARRSFLGGAGIGAVAAAALLAVLASLRSGGEPGPWKSGDTAVTPGRWVMTRKETSFELGDQVRLRLLSGRARLVSPNAWEIGEGTMWAWVRPGSGAFSILTPSGAVSVKGTEFWVRVERVKTKEEAAMNSSFWIGTGAGIATTVAVAAGVVLFHDVEVPAGKTSTAIVGRVPSAPEPIGEKLVKTEADLGRSRAEEARLREAVQEAERRAKLAEDLVSQAGAESRRQFNVEAEALKAWASKEGWEKLKTQGVPVGGPVPDEVAAALGVTDAQRAELDSRLDQEAERMKGTLRGMITGDGGLALPAEETVTTLTATLLPRVLEDNQRLQKDPRWLDLLERAKKEDRKPRFEEMGDILGRDSIMVRFFGGLGQLRRDMVDRTAEFLAPEQVAKYRDLAMYKYRLGGYMLDWYAD